MRHPVKTLFLASLLLVACSNKIPKAVVGSDLSEKSTDKIVIDLQPLPAGGNYADACKVCALGQQVAMPDVSTLVNLSVMYCAECYCQDCTEVYAPAILLATPPGVDINYCAVPGTTTAALVPCDCSDSACIQNAVQLPDNLSDSNSYLDSCYGCSALQTPGQNGNNGIVECAGCLSKKAKFKLSAAAVAFGNAGGISNCDGQLNTNSACPARVNAFEKDWDAFKDKFDKFISSPSFVGAETGGAIGYVQETEDAAQDAAAEIVSESAEEIGLEMVEIIADLVGG